MHDHAEVPTVTPGEAADLIADGAVLIDVRERDEWDTERVPGSEFRPMSTVNDWYADLPKDRQLILMCKVGSRSARVVDALISQAGFDNVVNLGGGIVGWKYAGLETEI